MSNKERFSHPAAPDILKETNGVEIQLLEDSFKIETTIEAIERRCAERIELCQLMKRVDPGNPTWQYGKEFFTIFPQGPEAVWRLFYQWGVLRDPPKLTPPEKALRYQPREIMDLTPETLTGMEGYHQNLDSEEQIKLQQLAGTAVEICWRQYELVKSAHLRASRLDLARIVTGLPTQHLAHLIEKFDGQTPKDYLLAQDFIKKIVSTATFYDLPTVMPGQSADEIDALKLKLPSNFAKPIVGIAKGFSSVLQEKIESHEIEELEYQPGKIINLDRLQGSYLIKGKIGNRLPFDIDRALVATMNFLHHLSPEEQKAFIEEAVRIAYKPGPNKAAIIIVEPFSSRNLLSMVLQTNQHYETSAFDAAWGTTTCGGQTRKSFLQIAREIVPEIEWKTKLYPGLPPIPPFQSKRICDQQVALIGY